VICSEYRCCGHQVAPAELEAVLATDPAVADAIPRTPSGKLLRRALADHDTYPTASGPRKRASSAFSSLPTRMATLEK
jgi:acyl-coenzyme A synthetase/AMP-(fatty) acid ligase